MKEKELKKTSEEWAKIYGLKVLDPDGWDRNNFQFSWYEELVTFEEFANRFFRSIVEGKLK